MKNTSPAFGGSLFLVNLVINTEQTALKRLLLQSSNSGYRGAQLTLTKAECRYMLCGMITAPTIPTACSTWGVRQPGQDGTNMPLSTWLWLGFTVMYYTATQHH